MIIKDTLLEIVKSQSMYIEQVKNLIDRTLLPSVNLQTNHAIIISGIRRCGKSSLMRLLMNKFDSFHYFNFEDSRASDFELSDFEKLYEIQNELISNCDMFFFDEIQNIEGWERFVRTLLDRKKRVFITGSNSSLLSFELGTKLTGRHLRYELFPFSFSETLTFLNMTANIDSFEKYLNNGGFPEFLKNSDTKTLQELFNDILYRDIFVRHSIRNVKVLKNLTLYLISNVSKEFSYNSLKNQFELGSTNSVISLIQYLEECYMIFTISKFDYSFKKQLNSPKKIYCIDTGLLRANSVSFSSDFGRVLENIVFIELRRSGNEIFYYKEKNECDFVIKTSEKITDAYQVCYKLTEDNKTREMNGILEALNKFGLQKGLILTYNQDDNFEIEGKLIEVVPVWKWLINKN